MQLPDFTKLVDNKMVLSALSALAGGFLGNLIAVLRGRIKTLDYTVAHDRIGFSTNDAIFGSIQVKWQNHDVTNLFSSRVELSNQTGTDLTNLRIKVYTDKTLLLGQRTEILGTTHILQFVEEFSRQLLVPAGEVPTAEQFTIYNHSREYVVPVLNRGQRVLMTYLTTVPSGDEGPSVWLDMLHQGVRVKYRQRFPEVHGVPTRVAAALGLIACIGVLALCSLFLSEVWAGAAICLFVGLFAKSVGAFLYRGYLLLKSFTLR